MTEVDWVAPDVCTLPTTEQPLRVAEFDALFAQNFTRAVHVTGTHVRIELTADDADSLAARVRDLTARETSCCSFFEFDVQASGASTVVVDTRVPPIRADVLAALVRRAETARVADA